VKNFDEIHADREFQVAGKTFHWRKVRPEIFKTIGGQNGSIAQDDPDAGLKLLDVQIMAFLPESEHEQWKQARESEEEPVTLAQITAVINWLIEEQSGRPLEMLSPSDSGAGKTAASSKAK
jgi:hypothetical protein